MVWTAWLLPQPLLGSMCGQLGVVAFKTSFLKPQVPLPMQLGKVLLNGLFKQVLKSSKDWSSQMIWDGEKREDQTKSLQDLLQYRGQDKERSRKDRTMGPVW